MKEWQKKLENVNWMLKNRGFEITGLHGARSAGFYDTQASKGLSYIIDNFENVVKFLEEHTGGLRIKGIGICFNIKRYTEEETTARNMLNEMGLGEKQPEYKARRQDIIIYSPYNFHNNEEIKTNRFYIARLGKADKMFEICIPKDGQTKVRFGTFKQYNKETYVYECDWNDWQIMADRFNYTFEGTSDNRLSVERKMKKYLHEVWQ